MFGSDRDASTVGVHAGSTHLRGAIAVNTAMKQALAGTFVRDCRGTPNESRMYQRLNQREFCGRQGWELRPNL